MVGFSRSRDGAAPTYLLGYWNRWLLGEDSGCLQSLREEHGVRQRHFVGFAYADHEAGLSLKVRLFCKVSFRGRIKPTLDLADIGIWQVIRADLFESLQLRTLDMGEVETLSLPERPEWVCHYSNEELDSVRALTILRPLRAPSHPDDIRATVGGTGGKSVEGVWVRTERLRDTGEIEGILLNQPHQDLGLDRGDRVIVRVRSVPGGIESHCLGRADRNSPAGWVRRFLGR